MAINVKVRKAERRMLTIRQAASTLSGTGITEGMIRRMVAEKMIPFLKTGNRVYVNPEAIIRELPKMQSATENYLGTVSVPPEQTTLIARLLEGIADKLPEVRICRQKQDCRCRVNGVCGATLFGLRCPSERGVR